MSVDTDSMADLLDTSSEDDSTAVGSTDLEGLNKKLERAARRASVAAEAAKVPLPETPAPLKKTVVPDKAPTVSSKSSSSSEASGYEGYQDLKGDPGTPRKPPSVNSTTSSRESSKKSTTRRASSKRSVKSGKTHESESSSSSWSDVKPPVPPSPAKRSSAPPKPSPKVASPSPRRRSVPANKFTVKIPRTPPLTKDELSSSNSTESTDDLSKIIARKAAAKEMEQKKKEEPIRPPPTQPSKKGLDKPPISPKRGKSKGKESSSSSDSSSSSSSSSDSSDSLKQNRAKATAPTKAKESPKPPAPPILPFRKTSSDPAMNTAKSSPIAGAPVRQVSFDNMLEQGKAKDDDEDEDDSSEYETDTEYDTEPEEEEEESSSYETDTTAEAPSVLPTKEEIQAVLSKTSSAELVPPPTSKASRTSSAEPIRAAISTDSSAERKRLEVRPPPGVRRRPYSDVPQGVDVRKRPIRPLLDEESESEYRTRSVDRRAHSAYSADRRPYSAHSTDRRPYSAHSSDRRRRRSDRDRRDVSNRTREEETVYSGERQKMGLWGRLFGMGPPKRKTRPRWIDDESGESYGGRIWKPRDYNDDISQISDPMLPRRRPPPPAKIVNTLPKSPPREGSSMYVQPGSRARPPNIKRALEDLEPVSTVSLPPEDEMRKEILRTRKERRNTRTALAGLPPLSIRKYDSIMSEQEAKRRKAALLDLQTTSTGLSLPYGLDDVTSDKMETGSRMSKGTTETKILRKLTYQQARMVSLLERMAPPKEEKLKPLRQLSSQQERMVTLLERMAPPPEDYRKRQRRVSIPHTILSNVIEEDEEEDEEEIDFESPVSKNTPAVSPDMTRNEEAIPKEDVLKNDHQNGTHKSTVNDDCSKLTEDPIWSKRSCWYCVILLGIIGFIALCIWLLIKFVIFDESSAASVDDMAPTLSPSATASFVEGSGPSSSQPPRTNLVSFLTPLLSDGGQSLADPNSPQSTAIKWLAKDEQISSYDDNRVILRFVLATFYHATGGDSWTNNDQWLTDSDECNWYTDASYPPCVDGRFTQLVLGENNIGGSLPKDLNLLSDQLVRIDLQGTISGTLPPEYGDLTNLEQLRIYGKEVNGSIPASYSALKKLTSLDLSQNKLTGTIPMELFRDLSYLAVLDLHENQLEGVLPTEIANLVRLKELTLRGNDFDGAIPSEISSLKSLESLDLDGNRFSSFPKDIGLLTALRHLSASNNFLEGTLHTSLGSLRSLTSLRLDVNDLTGTIPSQMGQLTGLKHLILRDNRLSGTIHPDLGNIERLYTFRIDNNDLTGFVPTQVCSRFDLAESSFYSDCGDENGFDMELECACCNFCCSDTSGDCYCQFESSNPILCIP